MHQRISNWIARVNRLPAAWLTASGAMALAACGLAPATAEAANTNLVPKAELSIKETYDSNVYLQDTAPTNTASRAFPAKKDSWVTTLTPRVGLDYKPDPVFNLSAFYAPDIVFYHDADSEDHYAHRVGLTLGGKTDDLAWDQVNSFTYIDGSHLGALFARPQDVPAVGGIPLRERRDSLMYRGTARLTWTIGKVFLRPVGFGYLHDFRTTQLLRNQVQARFGNAPYVYVNEYDRRDLNGGLDLGYKVAEKTWLVAGYRYGRQDQFRGPSVFDPDRMADSPYDSVYHRLLVGVEGAPVSWLKLAVLAGPDIRDWQHTTPAGFNRSEILYWVDATATVLPTKADTIVLLNRRYEQPAFTSQSVYEDITYSISWKHKFDDHWTTTAGFQIYIGDWQAPVSREDRIYTPSASVTYAYKHLAVELAYSYDWVQNKAGAVPGTQTAFAEGREFTRHMVSLVGRYSF
jgi:hypothetical protein